MGSQLQRRLLTLSNDSRVPSKAVLNFPKGPFTRSDFKDPILGSESWKQAFRRSDFKIPFLW